jgi:hypothetical protein
MKGCGGAYMHVWAALFKPPPLNEWYMTAPPLVHMFGITTDEDMDEMTLLSKQRPG